MSKRIEKINDLIRDQIAKIITKDLTLRSGVFVSVLKVDTSRDLRYSQVFISVYPANSNEYVQKTLDKERFKIQGLLNDSLKTRYHPKISFKIDNSQENLESLEKVFEKIRKEKK